MFLKDMKALGTKAQTGGLIDKVQQKKKKVTHDMQQVQAAK